MSGFSKALSNVGTFLEDNKKTINTVTQTASTVVKSSKGSVGKSALKGAGSGASLGATVGSIIPGIGTAIGGAVGGVVGGIVGLFKGKKKKKKEAELAKQQQIAQANGTEIPQAKEKGGFFGKLFGGDGLGATLGKTLMGVLGAALVSYIIKDLGDNKKIDFSAKLFGKNDDSSSRPVTTLATPGINPYANSTGGMTV